MPAPPARIRSANVPCGFNSNCNSPLVTSCSNNLFSPTYVETIFFTCRCSRSKPMPNPSTPALLETIVRFFVPLRRTAAIKFSGIPHSPNPPIRMVMPSRRFSIAASTEATRLSISSPGKRELCRCDTRPVYRRSECRRRKKRLPRHEPTSRTPKEVRRATGGTSFWEDGIGSDGERSVSPGRLRQPNQLDRLSSADPDIDVAWNNAPFPRLVNDTESAVTQGERNDLLRSGVEMNPLEALQSA